MSESASGGRPRPGPVFRGCVGVAALALAAAACSSSSSGPPSAAGSHSSSPMAKESSSMPMASPSMSMSEGMLPMGAKDMHVAIVSPAAGPRSPGTA